MHMVHATATIVFHTAVVEHCENWACRPSYSLANLIVNLRETVRKLTLLFRRSHSEPREDHANC